MRTLVMVAALVGSVACLGTETDTGTGPIVADLSGVYALQTINDAPLPFTIAGTDTTMYVDKDVLVLDALGNWSEQVNYRLAVGTAAAAADSFQLAGIWSRSANSLNFRTQDLQLLYVGVATDTTLQLSDAAYNYLFKR